MTTVLDAPDADAVPGVEAFVPGERVAVGFPSLDLRLVQLVVESAVDAASTEAAGVHGGHGVWGDDTPDGVLIEQIGLLESLQHSLAAAQSALTRRFARAHVEARIAAGESDPERLERSVAAQVALATRTSPTRARARVRAARDLHEGLDRVRGLYAGGELTAPGVEAIVRAARDLTRDQRAELDRRLAGHELSRFGVRRLGDLARRLAAEIAPEAFRARVTEARSGRRVTLRPAEDGMAYLSAYVPVEQGAACLAALSRAHQDLSCSPEPLTRTRGQVLADTLIERVTGQATAPAVPVEIQALVPVESLLDPEGPLPAEVPGLGPLPADLLTGSTGRTFLRRLLTREGTVIGGESRRRSFRGLLGELVRARCRHRCSEPYCDAPVRHLDHIHRAVDDGPTELGNGRGLCEFHNHLREQPGWRVARGPDGVRTTTPTGHSYLAPPC